MYTPDREINPPSFYEREKSIEPALLCTSCGDSIIKSIVFYQGGKHYCNYCKEHILKIK